MILDNVTPEFFAAMAKAQSKVENATKGSVNPHFKNRYADLAEVLNTVRPIYAAHGICIIQDDSYDGSFISVITVLGHELGGYISSKSSCVPAKADAQGIGAATTYLRRYSLAAMTGVAQEDDDGQAASHTKPAPKPTPISAQQAQLLKSRIADLGVNEQAVAEHYKVTDISNITVADLDKVQRVLDTKEREQKAQAAYAEEKANKLAEAKAKAATEAEESRNRKSIPPVAGRENELKKKSSFELIQNQYEG